jgi:hypothetical protein
MDWMWRLACLVLTEINVSPLKLIEAIKAKELRQIWKKVKY